MKCENRIWTSFLAKSIIVWNGYTHLDDRIVICVTWEDNSIIIECLHEESTTISEDTPCRLGAHPARNLFRATNVPV
jgi:hypothetical protein